jgi:hypothetical protein
MKQTQTDWDEAYRRRETPWEKGIPHPALVDFLVENGPLAGEICVPSCGSGNDVRALSTPTNHVMGIDLATRDRESKFAAANRNEEYLLADLLTCRRNSITSSIGFSSTPFGAIDPGMRVDYVDAVATLQSRRKIARDLFPTRIMTNRPPHGGAQELERFWLNSCWSANGSRNGPIPAANNES